MAGHQGQLYAYLGQQSGPDLQPVLLTELLFLGLPSSSLLTEFTRAYDIFLHERDQFWHGIDMENIGQAGHIDLQLNTEIWGSFTVSQITKLNKVSDPCEEDKEYSFTQCLQEFVASSSGCYLDWV